MGCPTYVCGLIYLVSFKNYYFIRLYFIVSFVSNEFVIADGKFIQTLYFLNRNLEGLQFALMGCPTYVCGLIYLVSFKNYFFIRLYFIVSFVSNEFVIADGKFIQTLYFLYRNLEGLQFAQMHMGCPTYVCGLIYLVNFKNYYFIWLHFIVSFVSNEFVIADGKLIQTLYFLYRNFEGLQFALMGCPTYILRANISCQF